LENFVINRGQNASINHTPDVLASSDRLARKGAKDAADEFDLEFLD
jgi:hypothetical protein